jgi:hypothetical protein
MSISASWILKGSILVRSFFGCGGARQPENIKTVAALEVPLPSEADRDLFLSVHALLLK